MTTTSAPSRRAVLRAGITGAAVLTAACASPGTSSPETSSPETSEARPPLDVLLVFFSRAGENYHEGGRRDLEVGNTAVLAGMIADRIGCDVHEIEAADPYPEAYDPTVDRNQREQQADARPEIAGELPDVSGYDVVLLGRPVWNVRAPMIMSTLVESVDLRGRTVLPFVTYAVSGLAGIDEDYRDALPGSDVRTGLAVRGEDVADAGPELDAWLAGTGLTGTNTQEEGAR